MEIWVWLLIAAAFGGAMGWASHMLYLQRQAEKTPAPTPVSLEGLEGEARRAAELEGQLAKATAEVDDLRQKSGIPKAGDEGAPVPEGSLAWRNRHLESRVRFLEGKLADIETDGTVARPADDQNDEATRLRWRNRYLEGRVKYLEEELVRTGGFTTARAPAQAAAPQPETQKPKGPEGERPDLIDAARDGRADDLKLISGIGPKLEQKLNSIGIWHYDQVASWTQANIDWVNAAISFRGRIEREKWVPQAKQLVQDDSVSLEGAESNGA
jgi:predicted flap endonuclease-1-like 5' DNA nuclease